MRIGARRYSGREMRTAEAAPPRGRGRPRSPSRRAGRTSAAATMTPTPSAAAMRLRETPKASTASGPTSVPETQERPRSPRAAPASQWPMTWRGPPSIPMLLRMDARTSGVGSRSEEVARRIVRAGSLPESHGSMPTRPTRQARASRREMPVTRSPVRKRPASRESTPLTSSRSWPR